METKIYNQEGKESGEINLPESVFGVKWNADLIHQVIVSMQSNVRTSTAHTKGRSDVRGGGKKPWQQKGTGRARHGSRRSPLWRGGGITHGPTSERNYEKKVNKKMAAKALAALLSEKLKSGRVIFVDSISFSAAKTKEAAKTLSAISKVKGFETLSMKKSGNVYFVLPKKDDKAVRAFKNLPQVETGEARNLNALDLVTHRYIVVAEPKESVAILEKRVTK
ncbi:MAG: 50S ribosomal protein L4 [Patescibacteria group bacterium]